MTGTAATSPAPRRKGLARLLAWNDRPDFVPSLRDERGAFLTPGLFTGVRGARAQTAALAEARRLARLQERPLFAFIVEARLAADPVPDAGGPPPASPSPLAGSLDLTRLSRRREQELRALLGMPPGPGGGQDGGRPADPAGLADLAARDPAGFFQTLFAHPASARLALVQWDKPGGARGVCASRRSLPLATCRPCQIAGITLCAPARDLLQGLDGSARDARVRYLLGLG